MWGFEYKPTPGYTPPYQQNENCSLQTEPIPTERIIEAKQAFRRIQVSMVPSRSITTSYASRGKSVAWCEEQEESSHSRHAYKEHSKRIAHSPEQSVRRAQTETCIPPSTHRLSERLRPRVGQRQGAMLKHNNTPTLMVVGPPPPPVLRVSGPPERGLLSTFTTPFSREIIEAARRKKFKMPSVELFGGITDPNDHLDVYKARMYV